MQEINKDEFYAFQSIDSKSFIYGEDFRHEDDGGNWGWVSLESCYPSFSFYSFIARFDMLEEAKTEYNVFDNFMQTQIKIVKITINIMVEDAK